MYNERPNPDALLARVQEEASRAGRGKLKIFFGYAAGVGKTYADAHRRTAGTGGGHRSCRWLRRAAWPARDRGFAGLGSRRFQFSTLPIAGRHCANSTWMPRSHADHHCCSSTSWPTRTHPGCGTRSVGRMSRSCSRPGINVWTTLNVQHIESLNDVIAQITGVAVKETLPDTVLERADEIELIDITPDKLMERLAAGKVYVPAQAERALKNFFQKGNLVALRELSLRQAASRVQQDVESPGRNEPRSRLGSLRSECSYALVLARPTRESFARRSGSRGRSGASGWR